MDPPVLGVMGWSGAGKTTLLEAVIARLCGAGLRLATVKHAHHRFDIDHPGKDSWRHRQAGALQVLVASSQRIAHIQELDGRPEPTLPALLARLQRPVDLVLVEGFKAWPIPRLEVWRPAVDRPPISLGAPPPRSPGDPGILALALPRDAVLPAGAMPPPVRLDLDDVEAVAAWILAFAGGAPAAVAGVILAGGQSQRMGRPKAWVTVDGVALAVHARATLAGQVTGPLAVSARADDPQAASLEVAVLHDDPAWPEAGPLAGVLAALRWAPVPWVMTLPVDQPFVPPHTLTTLRAGASPAGAIAKVEGRAHPLVALWHRDLAPALADLLQAGVRRVREAQATLGLAPVPIALPAARWFANLNTPQALDRLA